MENRMNIYFAPMEGITGRVYRRVHHRFFPGIDKYYTPFISLTGNLKLKARDRKELEPAENPEISLVPQFLGNDPEAFRKEIRYAGELGYSECNINLGCPSKTVTTKKKGSGLLDEPELLKKLLDGVFEEPEQIFDGELPNTVGKMDISVKTRLGGSDPEEIFSLLDLFNRYPISELTIHPRVRDEGYRGRVHLDYFEECLRRSENPVCYNGDIRTVHDFSLIAEKYPNLRAVMIGRGLVGNPALVREIRGGAPLTAEELKAFHDSLLESYMEAFQGDEYVSIRHMLELWPFMKENFTDADRLIHKIFKTKRLSDYRTAVDKLFEDRR
jgi:tRNA-dihydrouridine synthase